MGLLTRAARAFALASLALWSGAMASASDELPKTEAEVSWKLGAMPLYCASVDSSLRICTWHVGGEIHVVCELSAEPESSSCRRFKDNTSMRSYPDSKRTRVGETAAMKKEARQLLKTKKHIRGVIELVGAGPSWCSLGDRLVCGWRALRRTPGYRRLAIIAAAPGKRLAAICRFSPDGSVVDESFCRVGPDDEVLGFAN